MGFPGGSDSKKKRKEKKNPPAMQEIQVQSLGWEDSLDEGTGTQPCLATSWTEEPGALQSQSMGSQRVGHD